MCESKIAEEKGVADQFRHSIEAAKEEMVATSAALKVTFDRSLLTASGTNLTETLSNMESSLENLRATAAKAKAQLADDQAKMLAMHKR